MLAWQRVRTKNTAGGIDRQTVESYNANLEKNILNLSNELSTGKYIQQPYLTAFIPKNENEKRQLGLLTINDKIVQTAATFVLNPLFERSFLKVSYAYRSKKGAVKAIHKVQSLIAGENYSWLASCDINNFFDTIPHHILFRKLAAFLRSPGMVDIIIMFVTMGKVNKAYAWKDNLKGIPQGGVISPNLANFYLFLLDKLMMDKGYGFVRYADDFIILGKTEAEAVKAMDEAVSLLTNHLQLALNEGSKVIPVSKGFEFLGIEFQGANLTLSARKFKRLSTKMLEASRVGDGLVTNKLLEVMRGVNTFYAKLIPQETLCLLDDELMAILRNKASIEYKSAHKIQKLLEQFKLVDFFARQHNFKRKEYIESQFKIRRVSGDKGLFSKTKRIDTGKAVRKRKHEYQKLESSGFDLIVTTPGTWLSKRNDRIVVKHQGTIVQEVPLINLKNITILNEGVSFSSNVIEACCEYKISIDFIKFGGKPYAIIHQPEWFDASIGLAQLYAYQNGKCYLIIRQIIGGKIANQMNLLKYYGKYYNSKVTDYKQVLDESVSAMGGYFQNIMNLPTTDLEDFRMKILAYEGLSASKYWDTLGLLLNTRVKFEKRGHQGAHDLVNCMLNYGYGILYGKITEAIVGARLNPALSFLHTPSNNRPALVFDFIEEFRQQVVDRTVFALVMKSKVLTIDEQGLLNECTRKLLAKKVIERLNTVEVFRNKEMRLFEIINLQAKNLAQFLTGEKTSYRPYIRKW